MTENDARGSNSDSLSHVLDRRAETNGDTFALRFLSDGRSDSAVDWTYADLATHTRTIAARLRDAAPSARRVVSCVSPGLPFVAAFFGVLRVGATVVPAYPPFGRRATSRFTAIVEDSRPDAVLVDGLMAPVVTELLAARGATDEQPLVLVVDDSTLADGSDGREPGPIVTADPAVLQYSSGSTGEPKGVVITHANLQSNSAVLATRLAPEPVVIGCSWLPPYHDMGLMGTLLMAIHGGWPLVLLSPTHFVQDPYRWLRAITDHAATISAAPNFALDLCVNAIPDEALDTLDLSSLRQVFCGAEPVSSTTLDRFTARFGPCGFDPRALVPCYGLAEATLYVSGAPAGSGVLSARFDRQGLEHGRALPSTDDDALSLVSCGVVAEGHEVCIVDPDDRRLRPAGDVGEIWVHGPSVAAGYHERPADQARTFGARLAADQGDDRTWLRTGDLGFLRDGELFVTGRIKDLIIVAGRNLYPQDIEESVRRADARLDCVVAFAVESADAGEEVVIVAGTRRPDERFAADADAISEAVVAAVTVDHGVRPTDVVLTAARSIPTTTSGKIRRRATREAYRSGTLDLTAAVAR